MTEWNEFRSLDLDALAAVDGARRSSSMRATSSTRAQTRAAGFTYHVAPAGSRRSAPRRVA